MRKHIKYLLVLGTGLLFALTAGAVALSGVTDSARAAACYDGAKAFSKADNLKYVPTGDGLWKTTSRCQDINVRAAGTKDLGDVRVCFYHSSGTLNYCQSSWKYVGEDWVAVATDVKDGTYFKLHFSPSGKRSGYAAY